MRFKDTFFSRKLTINCGGELIDLSEPKVMGILNITPDSFYDGGKNSSLADALNRVEHLIDNGCDILDVGAYSSRPGAEEISASEELKRLLPILNEIRKKYPDILISVDTFRSEVARTVVSEFNVNIINDISAGELDSEMFATIAELKVPYIIMHMQGNPGNMQVNPQYGNVINDIIDYFSIKVESLKLLGVNDVIIDPGFGFGKTLDNNYQLLKYLDDFKIFELPLLVGVSRKSMICKALGVNPIDALNGTTVLNIFALDGGANILRVHDVKEAKETIMLYSRLKDVKIDNWYD